LKFCPSRPLWRLTLPPKRVKPLHGVVIRNNFTDQGGRQTPLTNQQRQNSELSSMDHGRSPRAARHRQPPGQDTAETKEAIGHPSDSNQSPAAAWSRSRIQCLSGLRRSPGPPLFRRRTRCGEGSLPDRWMTLLLGNGEGKETPSHHQPPPPSLPSHHADPVSSPPRLDLAPSPPRPRPPPPSSPSRPSAPLPPSPWRLRHRPSLPA
jgi:hypothetical protein